MKVFSIAKGFYKLSKSAPLELSQKEFDRLRAITIWHETRDIAPVCQTFGISRATLYRWLKRFDPRDLSSLRDESRRPRTLRGPLWSYELLMWVRYLREQYPRWGKEKLVVLLRSQGQRISASTVGRILRRLRERGELVEPKRRAISAKRRIQRAYGMRKPGDLVQVDTLDIRPLPKVVLKQFTARDVVSRWDVLEARTRATTLTAKEFIETLQRWMPFKVKALQVDGGSEFYSEFEEECQGSRFGYLSCLRRVQSSMGPSRELIVLIPRSFMVYDCAWKVPELNRELRQWGYIYNCVRPHQALAYKTPLQFLRDHGIMDSSYTSNLSHMY